MNQEETKTLAAGTTVMEVKAVFNCPIHGFETDVFCFRGYDSENAHLWYKCLITYTVLNTPVSRAEVLRIFDH